MLAASGAGPFLHVRAPALGACADRIVDGAPDRLADGGVEAGAAFLAGAAGGGDDDAVRSRAGDPWTIPQMPGVEDGRGARLRRDGHGFHERALRQRARDVNERVDRAGKGLDHAARADRFAIGEADRGDTAGGDAVDIPFRDMMPPDVARRHDMGVTQIIRGDDHLTNAARQTHIYEAMGWTIPAWAHIPLIHGADGAKLSKRHGALGVDAYRAMGYLPAALRNYLVRLGWSQGDREFFSTEEMIEAFDLAQVHRSPARFDFVKLENMNGHYMRAADDAELTQALIDTLPYLPRGPEKLALLDETRRAQLRKAMPGLKERAKTLVQLADSADYLFDQRPLTLEPKAAALAEKGRAHLKALHARLSALSEWTVASTEGAVRAEAEASGAKLGDLAQPLRAALTGKTTSPGIFDVLETLGREESLGRIADSAGA